MGWKDPCWRWKWRLMCGKECRKGNKRNKASCLFTRKRKKLHFRYGTASAEAGSHDICKTGCDYKRNKCGNTVNRQPR